MTAGATSASSPRMEDLLANVPPEETPDLSGAFPRLDEARIRTLEALGERRPVTRGDVLIAEGQPEDTFYVVLSGRVAVVEGLGCPDQRLV
ncbi:MAG: cyclic nucleotide-binding protein, partial [Pseudonocardia sp.]|nr:cyclic nucleotide-binding protein [Pseudonocardia sp.]